jgi:pimeloyl-ACP methyl ester carboxylesterase
MKSYYLTQITTKDQLIHQGIYFRPARTKSKTAILWVHGLMSNFYGNVEFWDNLTDSCEKSGIGFAAFNNRGHDIVVGIKKRDPRKKSGSIYTLQGASGEKFEDCIKDIEAGVQFLIAQKFSKIILVGHSTGANKVCYYAARKPNPKVVGVVLASPMSDRLIPMGGTKPAQRNLRIMQKFVRQGRGDELMTGYQFCPMTPKRFVSLYQPRSAEDVFDYGDRKPVMKDFSRIQTPLCVMLGEADEYLDRPAREVQSVFDSYTRAISYISIVIPCASHGFKKNEKIFSRLLVQWIKCL